MLEERRTSAVRGRRIPIMLTCAPDCVDGCVWSSVALGAQATPSLVANMQDKRQAKLVFRCTLYYTFTLYVLLCFVTTYYFGDKVAAPMHSLLTAHLPDEIRLCGVHAENGRCAWHSACR